MPFEVCALHANGVELELLVQFIFVGNSLDNFGIGVEHASVSVHQRVNHVLRHDRISGKFFDDNISNAACRLPTHTHISVGNFGFEGCLKLCDNRGEALHSAVEVVHHALFYTR